MCHPYVPRCPRARTSSEETLAAYTLPCHPPAPSSWRLCCSVQYFGSDPLKIFLCKISLGVRFLLCALSKYECCFVFLHCVCTSYIFHTPGKSCSAACQKTFRFAVLYPDQPKGDSASPCVCRACVSSG